jgi:hypothetical protein
MELFALVAVNAHHLVFFIMDVSAWTKKPHIFSGKTGAVAGVTRFFHGRSFLEPVPIEETAFGNRGPGHMTGAATGVAIGAVQFPGSRQEGVLHLVRRDDSADNVLYAAELVVHGILVGGGYIFVALPAGPAAVFFGGVSDQPFMGLIHVIVIFPLVTVDAADLPVDRFNKILVNTIGIPAPHLRGGNASTGYRRAGAR